MPLPNLNNNSHHNEHPILNHQVAFIPNNYNSCQSIPQSNNDNQPNPPQNILIHIQRKNLSAIDQQNQDHPKETIEPQANPTGKSLKPNPISNPNCETRISAPILLPTPTPNPNLEPPFSQAFPLPLCSALPNPTHETLPNAPTPKPNLKTSPQYESLPPTNRITTNPFSEPLPLQVSSMSLHRDRTLTLTAAEDATKLTPTKPIPANIPSHTTDEQQSKDSTIINHTDSNNLLYPE